MNTEELATLTKLIDNVFESLHNQIDDTKAKVNMMLRLAASSSTVATKVARLDGVLAAHPPPEEKPNVSVNVAPMMDDLFLSPTPYVSTRRPTIRTPPTNPQLSVLGLSKSKHSPVEEAVEEETEEAAVEEEATEEAAEEETAAEEAAEEETAAEEAAEEETAVEEETEETAEETAVEEATEEETEEEAAVEEATEEEVEFEEDTINGRKYFRATIDGEQKIYAMISEEEPGDEIGRYVKGKPVFDKVRELLIKLRKYYVGLDEPYTIYEYVAGKQQPGGILGVFKDNKAPVWAAKS